MPKLSVVIPAYNNGSTLRVVLDALCRQTMPAGDFEVIVGDDGSTPPLAPVVEEYADRLQIACVRAERNHGRSANRNAAAARASSEALLFLDADTVAHPRLLERHAAHHTGRFGRPGVLLGQRFDVDWIGADAVRRGQPVEPEMLDAERADPRAETFALPERMRDFPHAPWVMGFTHNASVDRASFDKVGGFDEAMVRWGMEDMEFFYRVFHAHGGAPDLFGVDLDAVAYHLPHYRSSQDSFTIIDNLKHMMRKHPRYDIEALFAQRTFGGLMAHIRLYGDSLDACRRAGLGRPAALPGTIRDALPEQRALVIGFGVSKLALGAGSHTFDHDAPLDESNHHMIGLVFQQFKTGQFDVIVNIDLWRFLLPEDLSRFVQIGLRKADRIELVAGRADLDQRAMLPAPCIVDFEYAADMLSSHFNVAIAGDEATATLTIC